MVRQYLPRHLGADDSVVQPLRIGRFPPHVVEQRRSSHHLHVGALGLPDALRQLEHSQHVIEIVYRVAPTIIPLCLLNGDQANPS